MNSKRYKSWGRQAFITSGTTGKKIIYTDCHVCDPQINHISVILLGSQDLFVVAPFTNSLTRVLRTGFIAGFKPHC